MPGPVEVFLTVDEERGLTGAAGVQAGFFTARRMINLDSEEEGILYVGCAGGGDSELTLELARTPAAKNSTAIDIKRRRGSRGRRAGSVPS